MKNESKYEGEAYLVIDRTIVRANPKGLTPEAGGVGGGGGDLETK